MAGNHRGSAVIAPLHFYAEIKPQLAIANVTIGFSTNQVKHVEVGKHEIQLFGRDYKYLCSLELNDVTLQPKSCHGLNWSSSDGLSFRIQTANCHSESLIAESSASLQDDMIDTFNSPTLQFTCRKCQSHIGPRKRFGKVLPLPSDGWSEFADAAFCHAHDHDSDTHSAANEHKNGQDSAVCLVGTYFALISAEYLHSAAVKWEKDSLICSKCRSKIGDASNTPYKSLDGNSKPSKVVQLHLFNVSFKRSTFQSSHSEIGENVEHWLARFLQWQAAESSSFRILVEKKSGDEPSQPYILIWLMDSKALLCHGKISPTEKIKPKPFIKIMYKDCLRQKNEIEVQTWRHDFSVLHLALPDELCALLLKQLISNTKTMPRSQQLVNGYYVSYLMLPG